MYCDKKLNLNFYSLKRSVLRVFYEKRAGNIKRNEFGVVQLLKSSLTKKKQKF